MPPGASNNPNPIKSGGSKPKPAEKLGKEEFEKESSLTDSSNKQPEEGQGKPEEAEKAGGRGKKAAEAGKKLATDAIETAKDVKDVAKAGPTGLETSAQEIKQGQEKAGAKGAAAAAGREAAGQAVATGIDVLTAGATTESHGKIAKGVSKVLKKENLKKIALALVVIIVVPGIIIGLIVGILIYAAQDPAKFLSQVLTDPKVREFSVQAASMVPKAVFGAEDTLKQYGYVEKRPGTAAIAQSSTSAPKPGSLADKLTKINLKNAVYQTNSAPDCPYRYTTKEMIGPKGDTIAVIDKVTTREGIEVPKDQFLVQYCIIQSMPIYNLMIRTDKSRGVNEFSNTVLNYGDDPEFLKDSSYKEALDVAYDKTYGRITSKKDDAPTVNNENVNDYIVNVRKALEEGTDPYAVDSNFQFKPGFDTEDKKTVATMCTFAQGYLAPENIRKAINARLNTGQRSGVKWNTISSTRHLGLMSNQEVGATLTEVQNWQASRAYSQNVYGHQTGEAVNPESLSNTAYGAGYYYAIAIFSDIDEQCSLGEVDKIKADYSSLKKIIISQSNGKFTNPDDFGLQQLMVGVIRMGGGSAISGLEPGPQNFNNQSQGFRGLSNQYMMRIGGKFLTNKEAHILNAVSENTRREVENKNGLAYRLFDGNNIRSLANIIRFESPRNQIEFNQKAKEYIAQLGNPVKVLADIHSSLSYYATGKINQAFAADATGDSYMRLDTIGLPPKMFEGVDLIKNSDEIQEMLANGAPEQKKLLGYFEQCAKSNIPSRAMFIKRLPLKPGTTEPDYTSIEVDGLGYPYYPAMADKIEYPRKNPNEQSNQDKQPLKEEKRAWMACEVYLMSHNPAEPTRSLIDPNRYKELFGVVNANELADKYHLYLYANSMTDLMVELSSTEKSDNIYANQAGTSGGGNTGLAGEGLIWPVDPKGSVSQCFMADGVHPGVDISVSSGTNVIAPADGKVELGNPDPGGYGDFYFLLNHNDQTWTLYGHVKERFVQPGSVVKQGDIIAKSGGAKGDPGAGFSTGAHLHFETRNAKYQGAGNASNPTILNPIDLLNPTSLPAGVSGQCPKGKPPGSGATT